MEQLEDRKKQMFKSDFTMGQYDFERIHEMLKVMNEASVSANMMDHSALVPFYSILYELYKTFRPILFDTLRDKFEEQFSNLRDEVFIEFTRIETAKKSGMFLNVKPEVVDKLNAMQMDLLEIRQIIGLGIMVTREQSLNERLKKGLGLK